MDELAFMDGNVGRGCGAERVILEKTPSNRLASGGSRERLQKRPCKSVVCCKRCRCEVLLQAACGIRPLPASVSVT